MKAVTWQGRRDIRVETVPDPRIVDPTDAVIEVTTTGLCGSDLHLYEVLGPFLDPGDVLGHEPMGVVVEVGPEVKTLAPGNRVVVQGSSSSRTSCPPRGRPSPTPTYPGGNVAVLGLGPIGDMCTRIAAHQRARVFGIDLVPTRLARAKQRGVEVYDLAQLGDGLVDAVRDATGGRGPDAVIDAVGMEAHGSALAKAVRPRRGSCPTPWRPCS
ncbi:alcohol dehydrogenase catalytic domain-containing protein [Streptomyces sp. NPDC004050]